MKKPSPAVAASRAPWIFDGIDYGPARAAVRDLANWALDIAEKNIDDWPAARLHIRKTRKFVEARMAGKRSSAASTEDILFTTELLVRIFDEDLGLGISEALTILDALELPSEAVPMPRYQKRASSIASFAPMLASLSSSIAPTLRTLTKFAKPTATRVQVAPLRFCDACGYVHEVGEHVRHRNAA
jgi:hypothetical protein